MAISGALIFTDTFAQIDTSPTPPTTWNGISAYTDNLVTDVEAPADSWVMCMVMGAYVWVPTTEATWPTPPPLKPDVSFETFDSLRHANFLWDFPPNGIYQMDVYASVLSTLDTTPGVYTTYVDSTYPSLSISAPGSLTDAIASGQTLGLYWPNADAVRREKYAVMALYVHAPFDPSGDGDPVVLNSSGSGPRINDGTDSPTVTSTAADGADAGKGAIDIIGLAWDDTDILPTLPAGWHEIVHYADTTTGWAGMVVGRQYSPTQTGPYDFTATFPSSVKSSAVIDVYQSLATFGLHVSTRG